MIDLSVIILTKNEKLHIGRCLEKLLLLFDDGLPRTCGARNDEASVRHCERSEAIQSSLPSGRVFLVDCHSTDGTQEIARSFGAEVVEHAWPGTQAKQFNWALDNLPIQTKWVLRLDADEYLYPETIEEVKRVLEKIDTDGLPRVASDPRNDDMHIRHCERSEAIPNTTNNSKDEAITSLSLSLARVWMGKRIRFGTGKVILKRFFRTGIGRCEERMMDEHIVTSSGRDYLLKGEFADDNLNDLRWWTEKHLGYAEREACDLLMAEYGVDCHGATPLAMTGKGAVDCFGADAPRNDGERGGGLLRHFVPRNDGEELSGQAGQKRKLKGRYGRLPLFWRSFAYFCYRYFLRGGFLEGKAGFTWHFFQGWWYRAMVDARILEIKKACDFDSDKIRAYLQRRWS